MIRTALWLRLTHKYRDGWSSEDSHRCLGEMRITPRRLVKDHEGMDGGAVYVSTATVPKGLDSKTVIQALRDTLGGSNCRHEHDCCGCASTSVRARRSGRNRYSVVRTVHFNY